MSITFPAAYSAQLKNSSVDIEWIVHLKNDNAGYVYLASSDRTIGSNRYYGLIEDSGEISRDLDLLNCKASVAFVSMACADNYKNGTLSGELLHNGTDYYINQEVKIYACANNETTLANCALLYEGRLKEVDKQGNHCVLVIEQWTPFDHITLPTTKSTIGREYEPIVYGNFADNTSGPYFQTSREMWPAHRIQVKSASQYYAVYEDVGNKQVHVYEKTNDTFCALHNFSAAVPETIGGIDAVRINYKLRRLFHFRPDTHDGADYENTNEWTTNPSQGYNGNTGDFASTGSRTTTAVEATETSDYVLILPQFEGDVPDFTVYIYNVLTIGTDADGDGTLDLKVSIDGGSTFTSSLNNQTGVGVTSIAWDDTGDISTGVTMQMPETLIIRAECNNPGGSDVIWEGRVFDVYIYVQFTRNEPSEEADRQFKNIDTIYFGADGITLQREVQQVHRDMMDRYAGVDYANDYMENWIDAGPGPYDLDAARQGWDVRLWVNQTTMLKDILDKLQFEGCFIFMLVADSDGSGNAGGRYIWVQDSYSSGDVIETFTEDDYENLNIGHTDLYEVIPRSKYNYNRSALDERYQSSTDYTDSTEVTNWNLGANHYEEINLDYLVDCGDNTGSIYDTGSADGDNAGSESIVIYRSNLQKEPKIMIDFDVVNLSKSYVDIGDIIQVTDSNVNPYGETWSNLYFMVVSERRTRQGLSLTCREVYRT